MQNELAERAQALHDAHHGDGPLLLPNAWDALSARVAAIAGAPAVGTSSFGVSLARGYPDGQWIPWEEMRAAVAEIAGAVDVPVTADVEAGFADDPEGLAARVDAVLDVGAVGVNLEDGVPGRPGAIVDVDAQCERLAAARARADARGVPMFLNARCDVYFGAAVPPDEQQAVALARAERYVGAGADGFFLPGLVDLPTIRAVAAAVPVPLNVMLWPGLPPVEELAAAGVRRVSQGGSGFLLAVGYLERLARAHLEGAGTGQGDGVVPAFQLVPELAFRQHRR